MGQTRLSIDFGTTNTAAAFLDRDGQLHQIRLSHTAALMPSAVFADTAGATGHATRAALVVGGAAINLSATRPEAFEPNPKRRLREPDIMLADARFPTVELVAAVFRSVLSSASAVAGTGFDEVILTHPDGWAGFMQSRLREAAHRAGIPPQRLRLITEAQAAAQYYSSRTDLPAVPRLCVFDFGAGTCDVAVLDRTDTGYTVVASDGLEDLGGNDIDGRIFDWILRYVTRPGHTTTPANQLLPQLQNPHARLTLIDHIRNAKETLSTANRAVIPLPDGTPIQLTRNEFDALIHSDIQRGVALTTRVLGAAQQRAPIPLGQIYLVGGSSHIPLIHRELAALGPIATLGDPKTVVVEGALREPSTRSGPPPVIPVHDPLDPNHLHDRNQERHRDQQHNQHQQYNSDQQHDHRQQHDQYQQNDLHQQHDDRGRENISASRRTPVIALVTLVLVAVAAVVATVAVTTDNNSGSDDPPREITAVADLTGVTSLSTSYGKDGTVTCAVSDTVPYCWGDNHYGQLGDGTTVNRAVPTPVKGLASADTITTSGLTTCAIADGTAYCWGDNSGGQIGDGSTTNRVEPVRIDTLPEVTTISTGTANYSDGTLASATCAIADNTPYCWGNNKYGGLGDESTVDQTVPQTVPGLTGASEIVTSGGTSCAIATVLYCWGANGGGEIGDSTTESRATPVKVGGFVNPSSITTSGGTTCVIDGTTPYCWGNNTSGALGNGLLTGHATPGPIPGLTNVTSLYTSGFATCALSGGAAYCWGENGDGQLGDGTTTDRTSPVRVPDIADATSITTRGTTTCAIVDKSVRCWGRL